MISVWGPGHPGAGNYPPTLGVGDLSPWDRGRTFLRAEKGHKAFLEEKLTFRRYLCVKKKHLVSS